MLIALFGENCSGKSTLAEEIKKRVNAEVITGKDYLRMAKSEAEAAALFRTKLREAVTGANIVYVISEKEHLAFLPEGAKRVYVTADIEVIKTRFRARMRGVLPTPVEAMLERKHGCFEGEPRDLVFDGGNGDPAAFCDSLGLPD